MGRILHGSRLQSKLACKLIWKKRRAKSCLWKQLWRTNLSTYEFKPPDGYQMIPSTSHGGLSYLAPTSGQGTPRWDWPAPPEWNPTVHQYPREETSNACPGTTKFRTWSALTKMTTPCIACDAIA